MSFHSFPSLNPSIEIFFQYVENMAFVTFLSVIVINLPIICFIDWEFLMNELRVSIFSAVNVGIMNVLSCIDGFLASTLSE